MGAKPNNKTGDEPLIRQSLKLGVDDQLVDRALRALLKHHESSSAEKESLLGNDLDVQVQFSLARIPSHSSPKPIRIEIPHPLVKVAPSSSENDDQAAEDVEYDDYLQEAEACLIVKEESKPWVQDMIARFPEQLGCIKKVLGLQSLRTKHKSFVQRRELLGRFDLFLADDRILPMLTKALGGKFFDRKRQPVPIRLTRKEALPFAVQNCLRSTFMYLSAGTCVTVKAGTTAMPRAKLLANIQSVCTGVPAKVPRKWSNVGSISIKTSSSVALPVYNKTPEELDQIWKLAREEGREAEEDDAPKEDGVARRKRKAGEATGDLAKALKKQRALEEAEKATELNAKEADEVEDAVAEKPKKTSKKKRKESVDDAEVSAKETQTPEAPKEQEIAEETEEAKGGDEEVAGKPKKSSKKKRRESMDDTEVSATTSSKASAPAKKAKKDPVDGGSDGVEGEAAPAKIPAPTETKAAKKKRKGKNKLKNELAIDGGLEKDEEAKKEVKPADPDSSEKGGKELIDGGDDDGAEKEAAPAKIAAAKATKSTKKKKQDDELTTDDGDKEQEEAKEEEKPLSRSAKKRRKKLKKLQAESTADGGGKEEAKEEVKEEKSANPNPSKKMKKELIEGVGVDKAEKNASSAEITDAKASQPAKKKKKKQKQKQEDELTTDRGDKVEEESKKEVKAPSKSLKKRKNKEEAEDVSTTTIADVASSKKNPKVKSADKSSSKDAKSAASGDEEVVKKEAKKSSKKKRKNKASAAEDGSTATTVTTTSEKKTPKKKSTEGNFVASPKFSGAKEGYVFKKGASGAGYYKDVLPKVDKSALANLGKAFRVKKKKGGHASRKNFT